MSVVKFGIVASGTMSDIEAGLQNPPVGYDQFLLLGGEGVSPAVFTAASNMINAAEKAEVMENGHLHVDDFVKIGLASGLVLPAIASKLSMVLPMLPNVMTNGKVNFGAAMQVALAFAL